MRNPLETGASKTTGWVAAFIGTASGVPPAVLALGLAPLLELFKSPNQSLSTKINFSTVATHQRVGLGGGGRNGESSPE